MNILIIIIMTLVHDFHFSRVEMNHNVDEKRIEVSLHVYIDDLELAMGSMSTLALQLGTENESNQADSLISVYIDSKLHLKESNQLLEMNWVGKEVSEDLSAFYIHFSYPWQGKSLHCSNTILIEQFNDQKNMIYFEDGDKKEYKLFDSKTYQKQLL